MVEAPAFLSLLDYLGVAVFAVTGALAASRKQLDIIAFCFFGVAAGVGGGTLRDLLLGTVPVFWIRNPTYVVVAIAVSVAVFFVAHYFYENWSRYRLLLWLDAVGMSAYAVMGASKAHAAGAPFVPAVIMGGMTAAFGGVIRDILAGEPSIIIRREIYITAAMVGAAVHLALLAVQVPFWVSAVTGAVIAFLIRGGALAYGWTLPAYRNPPGRDPDLRR
ncbi:trimeric intracellular cation channel family protein [Chthonobacter albigriseus]|uniref:trimeric intracellular cation channel family protein n=1 Tax=Chthonobacter albigriseus TaxID=1683161 RepID=UPI0015EF2E83|nr:trimeric intracellular cation channel family protein [Chthonobacter albigriseus]